VLLPHTQSSAEGERLRPVLYGYANEIGTHKEDEIKKFKYTFQGLK
jgi:hypothetical protein